MRYLIKIYEIKVPVPGQSPKGNNLQDLQDFCPQGKANKKTRVSLCKRSDAGNL